MNHPDSIPSKEQSAQRRPTIQELLGADLASLTLGELLGATLSSVCLGERQAYLEQSPSEVPNGFYQRKVNIGNLAVPLRVPRTRNADFRPQVLPKRYGRGYPEESEQLILGLLASSRSIEAVRRSLRSMGVSVPESELQTLVDTCAFC